MLLKKKKMLFVITLVLGLGLLGLNIGCETYENIGAGTGIGAALGAGIGALVGDPGIGAAIGAGVGAMGGLAKDSMEKSQQNKVSQTQNDTRLRQLEINAEIDRQVAELQRKGYSPEEYEYRATTTVSGMIVVDPIRIENKAITRIIK